VLDRGREVIRIEAAAVSALESRLGESFEQAVDIIYRSTGRIIVTGMGKSGIIAKKIAATFTSTGTAALFLHPAEGTHGDLGMVRRDDVVVCISKSGNTDEIYRLLPIFKRLGVPLITMTGNLNSELAQRSDVVLDISVEKEACPFDLVPTASTTAALAMGDALAMALLERRNFDMNDFALLHPGGTLGRRLLLHIDDVMFTGERVARVAGETPLPDVIHEITSKRFGATCVVDEDDRLVGIITDGDLRRLLEKTGRVDGLQARDVMTTRPKTVPTGVLAAEALRVMEKHNIMQIIIVDGENRPVGMIHLHDLLKTGIA
jgi:arabinose-5-phosphate isomerase